jgi:16S rRNA (uracil1498-N3)-methyltransferase
MTRFFLRKKNFHAKRALIDGRELAHMRKVLRLVPGDRITVFDDSGWEHEAVIRSFTAEQGELEIIRSYQPERESSLDVTLALGLTKGEKMDFVIEKATELGVQSILPFTSTYAVPKLDEAKIAKRVDRWQKIALAAAKQCGRTQTPEILTLHDYRKLINESPPGALKLLFWEKEQHQSLYQLHAKQTNAEAVLIAIGPEGGFTAEEAETARAQNFELIRLGRRILRAETAAVAAIALVQFLWGDLR